MAIKKTVKKLPYSHYRFDTSKYVIIKDDIIRDIITGRLTIQSKKRNNR